MLPDWTLAKKFAKCQWKCSYRPDLLRRYKRRPPRSYFVPFLFLNEVSRIKEASRNLNYLSQSLFCLTFSKLSFKTVWQICVCFGQALLIHHPFIWEFLLFLFFVSKFTEKNVSRRVVTRCQCYKTFLSVIYGFWKWAIVFVLCKLFQPSLLFVGKVRSYPIEEPFRSSNLG